MHQMNPFIHAKLFLLLAAVLLLALEIIDGRLAHE
jgi:hypothetical protein